VNSADGTPRELGASETLATDDEHQFMYSPLSRVIHRQPVTCPPHLTVREVLARINEHKVGSMVIVDGESRKPIGVFTLRDLLQRVALQECDLDCRIDEVMTRTLVMMAPEASAYQAALAMARSGLRHLLVVDGDHLVGVVSQNDLFNLQQVGIREISADIREAPDLEALKRAARDVRQLAQRMLRQGTGAETLTQIISTLNDLLGIRIIELLAPGFDLPQVPMCWIALGSEGRFEQTLSTDQDNGIIFEPPDPGATEAVRQRLVPFARAVNKALDSCGFPLCRGDIMAGNPQWCLSLDEWRGKFTDWIVSPTPDALLNATIFFDFRPTYGEESLADRLRAWLMSVAPTNAIFLVHAAGSALTCRPALGKIRDFVLDHSDPAFPHSIDLKMYGSRPFVDAARVFSLIYGVHHTNTAQRLRMVSERIGLVGEDLAAMVSAFYFIHTLRLRRQIDPATPPAGANRVDPDLLNEMDRRMLKEAFKQARKLQLKLALRYNL
jgi:CBS domain-containing protein